MLEKTKRFVEFQVLDHQLSFEVEGSTGFGEEIVLLDKEDNLLSKSLFNDLGYKVDIFLSPKQNEIVRESIKKNIFDRLKNIKNIELEFQDFNLENYHKYVNDQEHYSLVEPFKTWIDANELALEIEIIEKRISEILNTKVTTRAPHTGKKTFAIRIVRPNSNDFNPPHRDPWLGILKDSVNSYIPIAGSSIESSLPLVPGSHHWKESEIERTLSGAKINGRQYHVPSVISSTREIKMIRPDPKENEFLVFTPYLIHGAGVNLQKDTTRVSLEMRYWRDRE